MCCHCSEKKFFLQQILIKITFRYVSLIDDPNIKRKEEVNAPKKLYSLSRDMLQKKKKTNYTKPVGIRMKWNKIKNI